MRVGLCVYGVGGAPSCPADPLLVLAQHCVPRVIRQRWQLVSIVCTSYCMLRTQKGCQSWTLCTSQSFVPPLQGNACHTVHTVRLKDATLRGVSQAAASMGQPGALALHRWASACTPAVEVHMRGWP